MLVGRAIDDRAPNYLKQAIGWSYHAPYAGHDGIQLAIGQVFDREHDHLFPYYRDMLTTLSAGLTAEELILNGISKRCRCGRWRKAHVQPLCQSPNGTFTMYPPVPETIPCMQWVLPGP